MGYVEYVRRQRRLRGRRRRLHRILRFQRLLKEERLDREQRRMQAHDPKNIRLFYEFNRTEHSDVDIRPIEAPQAPVLLLGDSYLESLIE